MPRAPQTPQLSPGQAHYVVQRLISERRVSPGEVTRFVSDIDRDISDLERKLEYLRTLGGGLDAPHSIAPVKRRRRGRPRKTETASPQPPPSDVKPGRPRRRR